jgi:ABC-2 type transport system ATP-binding protein
MAAIETNNITKTFSKGKITALQNFTLKVQEGVIFGLLGPNGAGKTTLIKLLLGIVRPSSGSAKVLDHPINETSIKARIGYLPENHRYPEFLRGKEVLEYYARLAGVRKDARQTNMTRLLELVKMTEWQNTKLRKYSKGMLQRLGLAQAMINDPDLLFLDEPTDGVDPIGRKEIRDILQHLRDEGKTIFLNSHLLSEVEMICDEVAILDKGRLVQTGTVEELTSEALTYRLATSELSDAHQQAVEGLTLSATLENGYFHVTVESEEQLNSVIDYLRGQQISIKAVIPHKHSLEESFIEILKRDIVS